MTNPTFPDALDALVRGENVTTSDDLTRFVSGLLAEEGNVTMSNTMKTRIANELGLTAPYPMVAVPTGASSGTVHPQPRSGATILVLATALAAVLLIGVVGFFRLGLSDDKDSGKFLNVPSAVPTIVDAPQESNAWLSPVTANECPEEELISRGEWMALQNQQAADYEPVNRADSPYSVPESDDAIAVVTRQRQAFACADEGRLGSTDALLIESLRRSWENSAAGFEQHDQIARDRIGRSKMLSEYVDADLGLTANDLVHLTDGEQGLIWDPTNAVQLADGRIALIPGWASNTVAPDDGFDGFAPVWMNIDGEWWLEEELLFCIGDCDAYWGNLDDFLISPVQSSPEASPTACESTSYAINSDGPINMRLEPDIRGDAIASLAPGTSLTWLCESQVTTDPESDGLNEDQVWMFFRTEDGKEGWIREIDVRSTRLAPDHSINPTMAPDVPAPIPSPTSIPIGGDNQG